MSHNFQIVMVLSALFLFIISMVVCSTYNVLDLILLLSVRRKHRLVLCSTSCNCIF